MQESAELVVVRHALELDPRLADSFRARAVVRARQGDRAGAIADLERFLELAPDHPHAPGAREQLRQWRSR